MNDYESEFRQKTRQEQRRRRRRGRMIRRVILVICLCCLAVVAILLARHLISGDQDRPGTTAALSTEPGETGGENPGESGEETQPGETPAEETGSGTSDVKAALSQAEFMAAGYDYDGAIELLEKIPDYQTVSEVTDAIAQYHTAKAACVAVDVDKVPHIFYHSLINDTERAFNVDVVGESMVNGLNAWMCTVEEFDKITQAMYDNGYVFVRLRDLVVETKDADGTVHFTKNTSLMLPPGKKAVVLSVDDLSYYHTYEAAGYPTKLVLDDQGQVKCEYTDSSGNTTIGDYDVVPRLNTFLEEHPDGAYKGARGLIALTGYNGVFGYRTDIDYKVKERLQANQAKWLDEHPEFNYEQDIADATVIADALKEEGWEFASHTWGHLSVTDKSVDTLRTDNEKWVNTVQNIVGPVDTIIFAHGNDIGTWHDYSMDNEKFAYYKSAGYNFFCNVDGSQPYWVQIRDNYVRQGRIDMDGYMLYQAYTGSESKLAILSNLFPDPQTVFDQRRPQPVTTSNAKA